MCFCVQWELNLLVQSPFVLGGTLNENLDCCKTSCPKEVDKFQKILYVDDIISGNKDIVEVKKLQTAIINIFQEANFLLYKWHLSFQELEDDNMDNKQGIL